jgi:dTDP-4-amino-4,6-dideoxygalactose transaminase
MVPFVDLRRQHAALKEAVMAAVAEALETSSFIQGRELALFEQEFADYCGARFGVGVANGTDALTLALLAVGVGPGDAVITAANTFIATAEAIGACGATPVFLDCEAATFTLDPLGLERHLRLRCRRSASGELIDLRTGGRLRAVIPVHLYGCPADMDATCELVRGEGIAVVEDAAQAHGALYHGRRVGGLGECGCFSFYPAKNLGAIGDGGMVVTSDKRLNRRLRLWRDHGQAAKHEHVLAGRNSRLDEIQAAVLRLKLRHLEAWNEARRLRAADYARLLASSLLALPVEDDGRRPVYHLYVVRTPERATLTAALDGAGIGWGIHYPVPLHLSPAYSHLGYRRGELPVCEQLAEEVISLPMFAELTGAEVEEVAAAMLGIIQAAEVVPALAAGEARA